MSTATITWVLPTTRTDGSALAPADIAGVDIFDMAAATPSVAVGSVSGPATAFPTGDLSVGDHGFTLVAFDTGGRRAAPSAVAVGTVPAPVVAPPAAVTGVTVTINP